MVTIILILLSFLALLMNLDAPQELSSSSNIILLIEFGLNLCIGRLLIWRLLADYETYIKQKFFLFFSLSFFISLLLLAFAWTPFLSINNPNWGFDPQRYYYYACQIIENGSYILWLNYAGVVYFYAFAMNVLGVDPLVPLFVNSLFTLIAVLLIAKLVATEKNVSIGSFVWLLLIPEIVYFNIMPSREILCMAMVVFIIASFVAYFKEQKIKFLLILLLEFLFLFLIRPPFAFPLFLSILVFMMFFSKHKMGLFTILILALFVVVVGVQLSSSLGSANDIDSMQDSITNKIGGSNEQNSDFKYHENSLAAELIPDNAVEFVIFGVIRSFLYLFPSPSTFSSLLNMTNAYGLGDFFVNITSLIMMFLIPISYVLLKKIKEAKVIIQIIGLTFLIFWIVIGAFNTNLIHVRYRLVYDLLYFSLVLYFISITDKGRIRQLITRWSGVLLFIMFLFFILKKII